jgi:DNA-binding transcriptional regulator YiaG
LGIAQRHVRIAYVHNSCQKKTFKTLTASIKTLAEWIQVKRHQKNLTAGHLASKMGITTALVSLWESGTCQPDERQREVLSNLLGSEAVVDLPIPKV